MKLKHLVILLLLLTACTNNVTLNTLPDPVPDQRMYESANDLSLTLIQNDYKTSPRTIETVIRNDSQVEYEYGDFFHIEVLQKEEWYMITYSDVVFLKGKSFRDFGKIITPGSEIEQTFSVEALDVVLPLGEYRLVKTFLSRGEPFHEVSLAVPFSIEE